MASSKTRYHLARAACLVWALGAASSPGAARAQDATRAEDAESSTKEPDIEAAERFAARAFEAYQEKRYGTAVSLYVEAFNAAPNADILYNIARIYDTKLSDRQLAMNFYRRYIADPGAVADRIKIANERLAVLREAELAASAPQPAPTVAPTRAAQTPMRQPTQSAPDSAPWTDQQTVGAVVAAVGVVGLGVGVGFGLGALSDASRARDLCDGNACRSQVGVDAANDASRSAGIATVGFGAGAALLGIGGALYFFGAEAPAEQPPRAGLRWTPVASQRGAGLELSGAW